MIVADLAEVGHILPWHNDLVHAAVDLPVPELLGLVGVVALEGDVQPVAKIVKYQAALAPVTPGGPGLPQCVKLPAAYLPAPVPRRGLKLEFLRRRARGEQDHVLVGRSDARLESHASVDCHQLVPQDSALPWRVSHARVRPPSVDAAEYPRFE
jgi:hypothetical protein